MMKVALATALPADFDRPSGGVHAVSVCLASELAKFDDLDVHVVTTDRHTQQDTVANVSAMTVHRLAWAGGSTLRHAMGPGRRQMHSYLKRLQPDVVHAHDTFGIMVMGLGLPRVLTIHGFIYGDTMLSRRLPWLRWRLWKRFETAGWADQPHIISISPYVRERLAGIATGVIHDIDNPIDERYFDIARQERRGTILCAAVICPRKNQLVLAKAVSRLLRDGFDVELRLAGEATDEVYAEELSSFVERNGLADRVKLLGQLGTSQVRRELASASVFALVSLEENSPMGIEEAMAARVPVVTSNRCGMPYMVREYETGFLVDPHDPDEIADRLGRLLDDASLRQRMGDKAREIAEDRFHPRRVAEKTRRVYDRVVGNVS